MSELHAWRALLAAGRRTTLLRATTNSRLRLASHPNLKPFKEREMTSNQIEEANRAVVESVLYALREDAKTPLAVLKRVAVNAAKAAAAGFAAVQAATSADEPPVPRS